MNCKRMVSLASVSFASLLLFVSIFYFVVPGFRNSLILTFFLSIITFPIWIDVGVNSISLRKTFFTTIIYFIPVLYAFCITIINSEYDFSMVNMAILASVYYVSLYIVSCFIFRFLSLSGMDAYFECIFYICIAQVVIIIVAMMNPDFKSFISIFQDPVDSDISMSVGGGNIRGFALSAQQYFGLSSAFCYLFVLKTFHLVNKKSGFLNITLFVIVVLVSITAGRTVFVGFAFCFLLIAISVNSLSDRLILLLRVVFVICFLLSIGFVFFSDLFDEKMLNWAFELFINFSNSGTLESDSSNELMNKMLYLPDAVTLVFGSGIYTNPDGTYFGLTDSGFMRGILSIGFVYFFFVLLDVIVFYLICRNLKILGYKSTSSLFYILCFMSIVLNIKGEFFGYVIMPHVVIFITLFMSLFFRNKSNLINNKLTQVGSR